jgi:hypothetical protein
MLRVQVRRLNPPRPPGSPHLLLTDVLPRVVQAQAVYAGIRHPYIAGRYDRH